MYVCLYIAIFIAKCRLQVLGQRYGNLTARAAGYGYLRNGNGYKTIADQSATLADPHFMTDLS